jgi:hypothetical protein
MVAASTVSVVSGILTPALLILAGGSLISSGLQRLGRIVDRSRQLVEKADRVPYASHIPVETLVEWMARQNVRANLVERALAMFYSAIGLFVVDSLLIAVNIYLGGSDLFVVLFAIFGVFALLYGVALMLRETRLSSAQVREEMSLAIAQVTEKKEQLVGIGKD